jgi:hypothetical protein
MSGDETPWKSSTDDPYGDLYETPRFRRRANWVIVVFALILLVVVALPFIFAFTNWF